MASLCRWSPGSRSARWLITVMATTSNAKAIAIEATAIASTVLASMAGVIPGIQRVAAIARAATTNVRVTAAARVVTFNPGASTDLGGRT